MLKPSETATYLAFYIIDQLVIDSGGLVNVADAGNGTVSDTSNTVTTTIIASPSMEVTKIASVSDNGDNLTGANDVINYTIFVKNTGNITLNQLSITDLLTDGNGVPHQLANPGGQVQFQSSSMGSAPGTIKPNENQVYNGLYVISSQAASTTSLIIRAIAVASSPGQSNNVSDTSDDGDDGDGNTTDDPTVVEISSTESTTVVIDPFPSINATKTAIVIDNNGNGINDLGDKISYTITIQNNGNQTLTGLTLTDNLRDGDLNSLSLTDPLSFVNATSGSSSISILVSGTLTFNASFIIDQQSVDSGSVINSINAVASSPAGTNDVNDLSDDGNDNDGNTESDPTVIFISSPPKIQVTKIGSVSDTNNDGINNVGDIVNYTITISNTGGLTIDDIELTDTLSDGNDNQINNNLNTIFQSATAGSSATKILVGGTINYTTSYTITQAIFDSGSIKNTVTAVGSSPGDNKDVNDTSDDPNTPALNDPTIISFTSSPSIDLLKSATIIDNGNNYLDKGDIIQYSISVINTGDVTLSDLTLLDTFKDNSNNTINLDFGPTFSGASLGSAQGLLQVSETATYTALYVIKQGAVDVGGVNNSAFISASSPGQTANVTDTSDDPSTIQIDDATITTITSTPSLEVTKTVSTTDNNNNGIIDSGDVLYYTIEILNTGQLTLTDINLSDTLTDGDGNNISLTQEPYFVSASSGSNSNTIQVGETSTFKAFYLVRDSVIPTGSIINSVIVTASSPGQSNNVSDTSDDGDDTDGNISDDPTVVEISSADSINVTKSAQVFQNDGNNLNNVGDLIVYNIIIENTGTGTLTQVSYNDVFKDAENNLLSFDQPLQISNVTNGSTSSTILPGGSISLAASYTISQSAFDSGKIINVLTATASSVSGIVSDTSDNGIDNDGNSINDPTITPIAQLEVTKTASTVDFNSNGVIDSGDKIVYTIKVLNTGSVSLTSPSLNDTMTDGNGRNINLDLAPLISGVSSGSSSNTILIGGSITYTATYTLDQLSINSGSVSNSVIVIASSPGKTNNVSDQSDNGNDSDGNIYNDPTIVTFGSFTQIEVIKSSTVTDINNNNVIDISDKINYTITIKNNSNVTLTGLTLSDILSDGQNNQLNLTTGPDYVSSSMNSLQGTIKPGEIITYQATYIIENDAGNSGTIRNTVTANASSPGNTNDVSDVDVNIVNVSQSQPEIEVTKTANVDDNNNNNQVDVGDLVTYTIKIENKGNAAVTNLIINENLTDGDGNSLTLATQPSFLSSNINNIQGTLDPGEIETYIATYLISNSAALTGILSNTVQVKGSFGGQVNNIVDISDDGDDTDGNTTDDPTIVEVSFEVGNASIEVTKVAQITDNGDNEVEAGDIVTYDIKVKNTGEVTLKDLTIEDILTDGNGSNLVLSNGPFYAGSTMNSNSGTILPGETANYIAFYIIEQQAADTGKIVNSVIATASTASDTTITDTSDDGDDNDGNVKDDPTEVFIAPRPCLLYTSPSPRDRTRSRMPSSA